jgi:NAD(P)-dependent dehydrogenase (short-subunit alcohol dehydrogenase family)
MKFENKVALVTGWSSGIGRAIALAMAKEGATVAVVASSSSQKAASVVRQMDGTVGSGLEYTCDLRNVAAIERLVKRVAAEHGHIDILVNCAGVFYPTALGDTAEEDFYRMTDEAIGLVLHD